MNEGRLGIALHSDFRRPRSRMLSSPAGWRPN